MAPDLSDEQSAIVAAPIEARIFVSAGAGAGKTLTLASRFARLSEDHGLAAGREILVLSFSRAAVCELRRRLGADQVSGRGAAWTFDSFATRLLADEIPENLWMRRSYDDRIRMASDLLNSSAASVPEVRACKHVLIDEVQDLAETRLDFAASLLARADCGFTLFGDPAQSIFEFRSGGATKHVRDEERRDLCGQLTDVLGQTPELLSITRNYRADSAQTREVEELGALLRKSRPDYSVVATSLSRFVMDGVPVISGLPLVGRMATRPGAGTTAMLCRTNAQALSLSVLLFENSIPHSLRRLAGERVAPRWIAAVAGGLSSKDLDRPTFEARAEDLSPKPCHSPSTLWSQLRLLAGHRRGRERIDLTRVAERIRCGLIPQEAADESGDGLSVSTIHRAKGLEFDRVVLIETKHGLEWRSEDPEEIRVLYVALSRAKSEIYRLSCPDREWISRDQRLGRVVVREGNRRIVGLEIVGDDIDPTTPAESGSREPDVAGTQRYVRQHVFTGDGVALVGSGAQGENGAPLYQVQHNGVVVGATRESFGNTLVRAGLGKGGWPTRFEGLHVEVVDTVAGHPSLSRRFGLGHHGLWNRVRVFGLGRIRYHSGEDHE